METSPGPGQTPSPGEPLPGEAHEVLMGELHVPPGPRLLLCRSLGSCVAVALHDPATSTGGMAHVVLPIAPPSDAPRPAKYAPTAIEHLVAQLEKAGARRETLTARVTGGSQMFGDPSPDATGPRNILAVQKKLSEMNIPITGAHVGGRRGRTVEFDTGSGRVWVRTADGKRTEI
ncbi:MAG: chemotaxis protein CheD [Euryarchaeota archaeon]|nr:chemotaxis protein CheD [Euryarchaeota archaeon]